MKVYLHPHDPGERRFVYSFLPRVWALPLSVSWATALAPNATSTMEDLDTWDVQQTINVRVLCFELRAVVWGYLFPAEEEDE